jgi:integrase
MRYYLKPGKIDKPTTIMLEVKFNGNRVVRSTKRKILKDSWNKKRERATDDPEINKWLETLEQVVVTYLKDTKYPLDTELGQKLDSVIDGSDEKKTDSERTMIDDYRKYVKDNFNGKDISTKSSNSASMDTFIRFLKREALDSLTTTQFSYAIWKDYQNFLLEPIHDTQRGPMKPFSHNTMSKKLKHLKQFLSEQSKRGVAVNVNFLNLEVPAEKATRKIWLNEDQLERLEKSNKIPTYAKFYRDVFLLQCNIGTRISDLKKVSENVSEGYINLVTEKCETTVKIPLTRKLKELMSKYNYQIPKFSEQNYNRALKDIFEAEFPELTTQIRNEEGKIVNVPLHEEISSHDAIRTFVTLSHAKGMSVGAIATITGKSEQVILRHYLQRDQKGAEKEFMGAWNN